MKKDFRTFLIILAVLLGLYLVGSLCSCQKEEDPQPVETVGDAVIYIEEYV